MTLGTIDRSPPPFFRQGPSALTKLALFSALAIFLMAADTRWQITQPLRAALATALLPLQQALQVPGDLLSNGLSYVQGIKDAQITRGRCAQPAGAPERARGPHRAAGDRK